MVIPCHDAQALLDGCLAALAAQTLDRSRFEVLVVETQGRHGAAEAVQRARDDLGLTVRHLQGPDGPAAKRNLAAAGSSAAYLAFTDPDCLPAPGWLEAGLGRLEGGAALVQGRVRPPPGETPSRYGHYIWVEQENGLYESANVFYERAAFDRAGGFPTEPFERFGIQFGEDTILAWRVLRAGGRSAFEPQAVVHHAAFPRSLRNHVANLWRARLFPYLVREVPELRETLLTRRIFLPGSSPDPLSALLLRVSLLAGSIRHRSLVL